MRTRILLVSVTMATVALGCDSLECGSGTIEMNGVCVAGGDPPPIPCAAGTIFDVASGSCIPLSQCDPETTQIEVNDAGQPICVGTWQVDCAREPVCGQPEGNGATVCGRIYDLETLVRVDLAGLDPADMSVSIYEPLAFLNDPTDPQALLVTVDVDSCGRYSASLAQVPGTKLIAVGVDDVARDGSTAGTFALTGVASPANVGDQIRLTTFVARRSTVDGWNATAGGGAAFETTGAYVPIFVDENQPAVGPLKGTPVAGVTITASGTGPDDDWYFSDTDPLLRTAVDPGLAATGPNGTGILINSGLTAHSGTGPANCTWTPNDAATPPGTIFVQEKIGRCE